MFICRVIDRVEEIWQPIGIQASILHNCYHILLLYILIQLTSITCYLPMASMIVNNDLINA